jgi:ABC-type dipeptide/oligopeptide/nickel transport system permease subunit
MSERMRRDDLRKDYFEPVERSGKIYDKKFETKPIGYFKDAMIRFSKNKTNVFATSILFFIILSSIIIPIVSNKNVEELDDNFANLPPRMPFIENLGFWDGTTYKDAQTADLNSIVQEGELTDDEVGLYLPIGISAEYVVSGTLENYEESCTLASELCVGGENVLRVTNLFDHVSIVSPDDWWLEPTKNPYVTINVNEITGTENPELRVYGKLTDGTYALLGTITEGGEYTYYFTDVLEDDPLPATWKSNVKIEFATTDISATAIFDLVEVGNDEEVRASYEGFDLSEWAFDTVDTTQKGLFQRQNGVLTLVNFQFKVYDYTFADSINNSFPNSKYTEVMTETFAEECNPDGIDVLTNPVGMTFPDACPVKEVISKTSSVIVDDVEYFSYTVVYNYAELNGYEEIPYFLFGSDAAGRDLFTLLWVATRTSLLLGFVVAGINIVIGVIWGSISGYYGGWTDLIMQRITEVIGRIPWLVILSIMIALLGPGIQTLIFILIVQGWIGVAAITRTQFYRYKGREYVLASRTLGAKDGRLIFRHILPNGIGTIITTSVLTIPFVIFNESTISFLGFGIGHGQSFNVFGIEFSGVSVGVLLADGRKELQSRPYLTLFPGILISILMITFNMFGNALRDAFNPALRGSE